MLEHIHADVDAIKELVRVLRPGGTLAISVPRWLPEVINWKLSDDYHNAEGGHIRIYTDHELIDKVTKAGRFNDGTPGDAMVFEGKDYAHGLHAPYWWIKCAVGVNNDDHPLARAYHKLLVWEIMKQPKALEYAGKVLDPLIGKSMVLYFRKPEQRTPRDPLASSRTSRASSAPRRSPRPRPSIAAMQEPCGAIPWTVGEHVDIWNHVEARDGDARRRRGRGRRARLRVGADDAARRRLVPDEDRRRRGRGRARRRQHDGLPRGRHLAPLAGPPRHRVRAAATGRPCARRWTGWSPSRSPFGGINWTPTEDFCLLTGNSSIYQSLRAGVALADLLDDPQPEWELAGGRLGHAVREHRDLFEDKSTYSMDWYYPVLGGAVRGARRRSSCSRRRWDDFVVPGLGILCVDTNPWVTGAETCELAMALDTLGDHRRALALLKDMQHLREDDGRYWTGWVYGDGRPDEPASRATCTGRSSTRRTPPRR